MPGFHGVAPDSAPPAMVAAPAASVTRAVVMYRFSAMCCPEVNSSCAVTGLPAGAFQGSVTATGANGRPWPRREAAATG